MIFDYDEVKKIRDMAWKELEMYYAASNPNRTIPANLSRLTFSYFDCSPDLTLMLQTIVNKAEGFLV